MKQNTKNKWFPFKNKAAALDHHRRTFRRFYDHGFEGRPFDPKWGKDNEAVVLGHRLGVIHRRVFMRAQRALKEPTAAAHQAEG